MIKCPRCEQPCSNSKQNEHRPFCSEKCKLIDFGYCFKISNDSYYKKRSSLEFLMDLSS